MNTINVLYMSEGETKSIKDFMGYISTEYQDSFIAYLNSNMVNKRPFTGPATPETQLTFWQFTALYRAYCGE